MTERVVALIKREEKLTSDRKGLWMGAAAAVVVLGLASWTFTHTKMAVQPATPAVVIAKAPADPANMQAVTAQPSRRRSIPARLQRTANSPVTRPLFAQHDIEIAPIYIEPIDVQPIVIATITQSTSITKETP